MFPSLSQLDESPPPSLDRRSMLILVSRDLAGVVPFPHPPFRLLNPFLCTWVKIYALFKRRVINLFALQLCARMFIEIVGSGKKGAGQRYQIETKAGSIPIRIPSTNPKPSFQFQSLFQYWYTKNKYKGWGLRTGISWDNWYLIEGFERVHLYFKKHNFIKVKIKCLEL